MCVCVCTLTIRYLSYLTTDTNKNLLDLGDQKIPQCPSLWSDTLAFPEAHIKSFFHLVLRSNTDCPSILFDLLFERSPLTT